MSLARNKHQYTMFFFLSTWTFTITSSYTFLALRFCVLASSKDKLFEWWNHFSHRNSKNVLSYYYFPHQCLILLSPWVPLSNLIPLVSSTIAFTHVIHVSTPNSSWPWVQLSKSIPLVSSMTTSTQISTPS